MEKCDKSTRFNEKIYKGENKNKKIMKIFIQYKMINKS